MKTATLKCIILGHKNFSDKDKLVFLYNEELGKLRVIAKGARLLKAPDGTRLYYQTCSVTLGGGQSMDVIIDTTDVPPGTYFLYTHHFGGPMSEIQIAPLLP